MTILWILTDFKQDPTVLIDSTQIGATFVSLWVNSGDETVDVRYPVISGKYTIIPILVNQKIWVRLVERHHAKSAAQISEYNYEYNHSLPVLFT